MTKCIANYRLFLTIYRSCVMFSLSFASCYCI